jgi:hypothetical protein
MTPPPGKQEEKGEGEGESWAVREVFSTVLGERTGED